MRPTFPVTTIGDGRVEQLLLQLQNNLLTVYFFTYSSKQRYEFFYLPGPCRL
jgi:hypothetical protein